MVIERRDLFRSCKIDQTLLNNGFSHSITHRQYIAGNLSIKSFKVNKKMWRHSVPSVVSSKDEIFYCYQQIPAVAAFVVITFMEVFMWGFSLIIVNQYEPKPWLMSLSNAGLAHLSRGKPLEYNIFRLVKTCNIISCIAFFIGLLGAWNKNRFLLSIYNVFYVNSTIAWSIGLGSIIILFCYYKKVISIHLGVIMVIIIFILFLRSYFIYHIQKMINTLNLEKFK